MAQFRCVFTAKPATRIDKPMDLRFEEPAGRAPTRVLVDPLTEFDASGKACQMGLRFVAEAEAPSADEALQHCGQIADGILSVLSLISGIGIPVAVAETIRESDPQLPRPRFTQFFQLRSPQPSRGNAASDTLISAIEAMSKLDRRKSQRVARADRELRSGQGELDTLDRFLHYWTGLEALNPLFKEDFGADDETRPCPNCGTPVVVPATTGIRAFFESRVQGGISLYRRMRDLRVALVHGFEGIDDSVVSEAQELGKVARKALRLAISSYLYLAPESLGDLPTPVSNAVPIRGMISATLSSDKGVPSQHLEQEPHLDLEHEVQSIEVSPSGEVKATIQVTLRTKISEGVTAGVDSVGLAGEGVSVQSFSVRKN